VIGNQLQALALTWVVLEEFGSGLALGTILMASSIPGAVFMLFGGVLSDRLSPRRVMMFSNAARGIIVLIMSLLIFSDSLEQWHLYVLMVAFGTAGAFFAPAMMSMIPLLVGRKRLETANSLIMGTMQSTGLFGPAVAGFLLSKISTAAVMGIDSITFFFATVTLMFMKGVITTTRGKESETGKKESALTSLKEGFKYAWQQPGIRGLVPLMAMMSFCFGGTMKVGIVTRIYEIDPEATSLGIIMTVSAAAGLTGSLLAGIIRLRRRGMVMLGMATVVSIGLVLFSWANDIVSIMLLAGLMALMYSATHIIIITWVQRVVREDMLGRVMSFVMFASAGTGPISFAIAGWLMDVHSIILFSGAGALMFLTVLISFFNRGIRTID